MEQRRQQLAEAAEKRSKAFQQGGGGEKLKAKAKALEEDKEKKGVSLTFLAVVGDL